MTARGLRRSSKLAVVAGIVTFSVLAGTGAGWAYWTSQATATTNVAAANLTITSTGLAASTLGNESISATGAVSLTTTSSVTFTNTTDAATAPTYTLGVVFSAQSGDATLSAATTLTVWPVNSPADCTPAAVPTGQTTGTWGAGVTVSKPLPAATSATYCLRSTVADREDISAAGGARTFTPRAAATLTVGSFVGSTTPVGTISSRYIYPLQPIAVGSWWYITRATTTWCWDVSGSGTTDGSLLISYGCKNNADTNQDFRYIDADGDGYGNFQARHAPNIRVAAAASTASGSAVDMRTANAAAATQQWQPQLVSGSGASGVYQFVNKYSGLCLSAPATSAGVMTQVTCTGAADQRFTLTQRSAVQLTSFVCENYGGTGEGRSVRFNWTSDWDGGGYTIQARKTTSTGAWTVIATAPAANATTASAASPVGGPFTSTGTYDIQILNSTGQVVGTDTVTVSASYILIFVDYYYARC